jgi:uncharacterized small protein (DUF1192 family)
MSERLTEEHLQTIEEWAREGDDTEPGDVLSLISDLRLARARVAALEGEVGRLKAERQAGADFDLEQQGIRCAGYGCSGAHLPDEPEPAGCPVCGDTSPHEHEIVGEEP